MQTTTLRELLVDSRDGEWGKGEAGSGRVKMRVIRGTDFPNIRQGQFHEVPVRYLEQRHADRKRLRLEDILIETAGGTAHRPTGRTALVTRRVLDGLGKDVTCASFARFLRIDSTKAEPRFIFWLLQHHYAERNLFQFHLQHTGVARFQFTTFADTFPLHLPERKEQRRIASVLEAYDDLIEVNRRRIALLEEIARRLFEEWFVRFRFPGHEGHKMIETPDGSIPEGWRTGSVGDLLALAYGRALRADARTPGSVPVIGSSGVVGWHNEALVKGPGIIVGRKGNVGAVIWSPTDFYPIDTVFFVETPNPLLFILHLLRRLTFLNSDAAVPGLNRSAALSIPLKIPSLELMMAYTKNVEPMFGLVDRLQRTNSSLAASRDLLLPRLVSGSLSIIAAERELEAVA